MKRLSFLLCLVLAAPLAARPAAAEIFGQLGEARPLPVDGRMGGAYLQFDKSSASLLGQLRLSFYPGVDFGFQGGLSRIDINGDSRTSVRVGGDFKVQIVKPDAGHPVAAAIGASLGIESADRFTLLSLGPRGVVSWLVDASDRFVPYAGASVMFTRLDAGNVSTTDLSLPLRIGAEYHALPDLHLLAELQVNVSDAIRDDWQITFGSNFPF